MYNFDDFLKKYQEKFNNCQYTYYKIKCENIVRKIFFKQKVSSEEKQMLKNKTNISAEEWEMFIKEYNREEEGIFNEPCFLDANNMPTAI